MTFRFNPFAESLDDVSPSELTSFYKISEGWYAEYKSQPIAARNIAKSLSAFANQYGGWLVFGVAEKNLVADSFPGLSSAEVELVVQTLSDASRDSVNPEVFYQSRVFNGPVDEIGLSSDRSIVVVRIPPGPEAPYIHKDGRVYRRVADSSAPKPETDRAILDRLWNRSDRKQELLESLVNRHPITSKGEKDVCFLHVFVSSNPYELDGDWYTKRFSDFVEVMKGEPIPFDNFFTRPRGFVARQINNNDPARRLLTWEFDRYCHSFITIPMNTLHLADSGNFDGYRFWEDFAGLLNNAQLLGSRVLDLNVLFGALLAISVRHRTLVKEVGVKGPFYVKFSLENVWRTVPFLDIPSFSEHVIEHGFPIVQDVDLVVPPGVGLQNFVILPELKLEQADEVADALSMSSHVFNALGIPTELLASEAKELALVIDRFSRAQLDRSQQ